MHLVHVLCNIEWTRMNAIFDRRPSRCWASWLKDTLKTWVYYEGLKLTLIAQGVSSSNIMQKHGILTSAKADSLHFFGGSSSGNAWHRNSFRKEDLEMELEIDRDDAWNLGIDRVDPFGSPYPHWDNLLILPLYGATPMSISFYIIIKGNHRNFISLFWIASYVFPLRSLLLFHIDFLRLRSGFGRCLLISTVALAQQRRKSRSVITEWRLL